MTGNLTIAVVGCGWIANDLALLARWTPGVSLTAACDISRSKAEAFAKKHKIPTVYTDFSEMLSAGVCQAVYLAVPHHLHFSMIRVAVDAGLPVFVEKPVTRTLAEGLAIAAYARERGVKVGVNYQYRYDRAGYRLAQVVRSGGLGRVLYARTNIPWHREWTYFESSPWHQSLAQAGGGTLITQASHLVDLLLWAIHSPAISASGWTDRMVFNDMEVEDFAAGTVVLENGAVLQITSSMVANPEQAVTLAIYGERGTALYTNRPWPRLTLRLGKGASRITGIERVPYWGFHAVHRSLKGFRDWILHDRPFLVPAESALPALAVVEAIYRSAREGRQVAVAGSWWDDGR